MQDDDPISTECIGKNQGDDTFRIQRGSQEFQQSSRGEIREERGMVIINQISTKSSRFRDRTSK
jgi:hypothetical protein